MDNVYVIMSGLFQSLLRVLEQTNTRINLTSFGINKLDLVYLIKNWLSKMHLSFASYFRPLVYLAMSN